MLQRIIGVVTLNTAVYEEIEHDQNATSQAAIVVAVVAIIGGILSGLFSSFTDNGSFLGAFLFQLISAFVGWFIWSFVTYFVGTSLFDGKADVGEMLRVLGFAQAPGILAIIPICGSFIGWVWTLVCTFIAIRQGLDLDNGKAALTAGVSFIAVLIVSFLIGLVLGAVGLTAGAGLGALQGLGG